jgi:hypothetical protein
MSTQRTGLAALVLGLAAWAQLALAPVATGRADLVSLLAALASLGVLAAAVAFARTAPPRATALALGAYPASLGVAAFFAGRHAVPRFDAPSRVLAALTALAYLASAAMWYRAHLTRVPVATVLADDRPRVPGPALRRPALAAIAVVAATVAVGAPAFLGAREPSTVAERVAGEALVRGRGALVTAAGTLIALALVLQAASGLVRAVPAKPRATSRAVAYVLWAACALAMRRWLDHAH